MAFSVDASSWQDIKDFVEVRNVPIQYVKFRNHYDLWAIDGNYGLFFRLSRNPADTTDLDDFENNYKPTSNRRSLQAVRTDLRKTPFGDAVSVEKFAFIDLSSTFSPSSYRDFLTESGSASVTQNTGEIQLSTGTTDSSVAAIQTKERLNYRPGFTSEAGIGVRVPSNPASGQEAKWGQFDSQNGWGFGIDSTGLFTFVRRAGTDTKTYQSNWNIDPLDRNGFSKINFDVSDGAIYQMDVTWYGYGDVEYYITPSDKINNRDLFQAHNYVSKQETTVVDPNQPIRAEVRNGTSSADFTIYVGGRQASVLGTSQREARTTADFNGPVLLDTNDTVPIISFRKKSTFFGRTNTVRCILESLEIVSENEVLVEVYTNSTLTGASFGSIQGISSGESALEVDKSATSLDSGESRVKTILSGPSGSKKKSKEGTNLIDNLVIPEDENITIAATRLVDKNFNITILTNLTEQW